MKIRSIHTGIHETHREAGADISPATVVATSAVIVENPLAGRGRVDDLDELEALGAESAELLIDKCIAALQSVGLTGADVRGYGKGAIVGAGSTLSKNIPEDSLAVERSKAKVFEDWATEFREKKSKEKAQKGT